MSTEADKVPQRVKDFLESLTRAVQGGKRNQIRDHLEGKVTQLSDKFYKQAEWPPVSAVEEILDFDETVIFLYSEMTTKHQHTKLAAQMTLENRVNSWINYTEFFDTLINRTMPARMILPVPTIWNLIDEFLYQYEEFAQYKSRNYASNSAGFDKHAEKWSTISVLKYLYRLIDVSCIKTVLKCEAENIPLSTTSKFATNELYVWLGYFALIGLCRLNTVTGDYFMAVKCIDSIDISQKRVRHAKVTGAYISLYYHLGFSYMMMRRYRDALNIFTKVLQTIGQFHTRLYDQKKSDKIFALVAILLKYCPKRLDEQLRTSLHSDHSEKVQLVRNGEEEQLFNYACPKFVSPAPLPGEDGITSFLVHQRSILSADFKQQSALPNLRAFLKLYSTVSLEKLGSLLDNGDKDLLKQQLLTLIHKNHQKRWKVGPASSGNYIPAVSIDFYLEKDFVEVNVPVHTRQFAGHFLYQINKLNGIGRELGQK